MKKLITLFALLIIAAGAIPFVDGYFFKKIFLQHIQQLSKIKSNDINIQLTEYHLGWLNSSAILTITLKDTYNHVGQDQPPKTIQINSTIHHGPLLNINDAWTIAYADVETTIGILQIDSIVSLNGKTWNNHYLVPAMSMPGLASWGGLSGNGIVQYEDNRPSKVNVSLLIGGVSFTANPAITLMPVIYTTDASMQSIQDISGNAKFTTPGFKVSWMDGRILTVNNISVSYAYNISDTLYDLETHALINSLQLPMPSPIPSFTNIKYTVALNNFNKVSKSEVFNNPLSILNMNSKVHTNLSANTESGQIDADMSMSLDSMPKNIDELYASENITFNAKIPIILFENVYTAYLAIISPEPMQNLSKQNPRDAYIQSIAALIQNKKLSAPDSLTLINLEAQHLTPAQLDAKLKAMPLTPDTVAGLESNYNQYLADKQKALAESIAQPKVIAPEDKMRMRVDNFIKQGYLMPDKNDYVINFSKKGQVLQLNSKDISNQIDAIKLSIINP